MPPEDMTDEQMTAGIEALVAGLRTENAQLRTQLDQSEAARADAEKKAMPPDLKARLVSLLPSASQPSSPSAG